VGVPATEAQAAYDALHLETTPFEAALVAVSIRYCIKVCPSVTGAFSDAALPS